MTEIIGYVGREAGIPRNNGQKHKVFPSFKEGVESLERKEISKLIIPAIDLEGNLALKDGTTIPKRTCCIVMSL